MLSNARPINVTRQTFRSLVQIIMVCICAACSKIIHAQSVKSWNCLTLIANVFVRLTDVKSEEELLLTDGWIQLIAEEPTKHTARRYHTSDVSVEMGKGDRKILSLYITTVSFKFHELLCFWNAFVPCLAWTA